MKRSEQRTAKFSNIVEQRIARTVSTVRTADIARKVRTGHFERTVRTQNSSF